MQEERWYRAEERSGGGNQRRETEEGRRENGAGGDGGETRVRERCWKTREGRRQGYGLPIDEWVIIMGGAGGGGGGVVLVWWCYYIGCTAGVPACTRPSDGAMYCPGVFRTHCTERCWRPSHCCRLTRVPPAVGNAQTPGHRAAFRALWSRCR